MGKMKSIAMELDKYSSWKKEEERQPYLEKQKKDTVNHPSHYTFGNYEVLPVLQDWFPKDPLAWQVVKYMSRYKHKGTPLQDLQKAEFYLKELIKDATSPARN